MLPVSPVSYSKAPLPNVNIHTPYFLDLNLNHLNILQNVCHKGENHLFVSDPVKKFPGVDIMKPLPFFPQLLGKDRSHAFAASQHLVLFVIHFVNDRELKETRRSQKMFQSSFDRGPDSRRAVSVLSLESQSTSQVSFVREPSFRPDVSARQILLPLRG
jgi:hypothetical protein